MGLRYTAKIYMDDEVLMEESGEDLDELYNWMMLKAHGKFGNISGEIIDNQSKKVVRSFRKSPPD